MSDGTLILITGGLLAVAIGASLIAGRLRVPGLLLFLGLGMAIGAGGFGWIHLTNVALARTVGIVALALILFEGGLAAGIDQVRPMLRTGVSLAVVGTVLTALITGLVAQWVVGLSLLGGLLLGSIVGATDSAALFSVLRGSRLKRRLALTLELESGLNDPVAILLVVGVIDLIKQPGYGLGDLALLFAGQIAIGTIVGLLMGALGARALRAVPSSGGGLYPVASIATAALAFGIADSANGSGFLAVYLTGLLLGSARIPARRTIGEFHAGLAYVSEIVIFITLGLLVIPGKLGGVALDSLAIAAALIFIARPLAVLVATRIGGYSTREALLLGGAGLRGAVPIVLATYPVIQRVPGAERYFDIVFFVVLASTLLQGLAFEPLARLLGQTAEEPALARPLMEVGTIRQLGAEVVEYPVGSDDAIVGRLINELGLPREALVNVIVRHNEALLPRGSTTIQPFDRLHILVRERVRREVEALFGRWRTGPIGLEPGPVVSPRGRPPIYSVRAWNGDAANPASVGGVAVVRQLRVRRGEAGALVQLEDARYAITDRAVVAVGPPRQLFGYCRGRIRRAESAEARAWWQELAGFLSQHAVR